jgi:hypothetical protein
MVCETKLILRQGENTIFYCQRMRLIEWFLIISISGLSLDALCAQIHSSPRKLSPKRLTYFLEEKRVIQSKHWTYVFKPKGQLGGIGAAGEKIMGTWKAQGNKLILNAFSKQIEWEDIQVTTSGVMIVEKGSDGPLVFECGNRSGNEELGRPGCIHSSAFQIIPGNKNKKLYRKVLDKLEKSHFSQNIVIVEGPYSKSGSSKIWYQPTKKEIAKFYADLLRPLIGPVEPQALKNWGAYDLVLVIARRPNK